MSELALKLIREEKQKQTGILDLGNTGLTELPDELFELTHLEELYLSNEYLDYEKKEWAKSKNQGQLNKLDLDELPGSFNSLVNLKKLFMGGGYFNVWSIKDCSVLKNLTSLQSLDLSNNQISDISFLKGLTSLQSLDLSVNQISDISFLKGLTSLQSLDLSNNQISDISFLKGLTSLQSLDLSYNQISDISFLKGLTSLQSLDLSVNQISDISFLKGLTSLQSLDLSYNQISDISFLKGLTSLQSLDLSYNQISDISFLKGLTSLESLDLSYNQISDYSFLKGLTSLQSLDLRDNQISDISFLKGLTSLQSLYLSGNQISDISFLKGLTSLQSLYLSSNEISDYSFLKGLTSLQSLYLSSNEISDYSFLKGLTSLHTLDLSYNQISELNQISFIADMGSLRKLKVYKNPFVKKAGLELSEYDNHLEVIKKELERFQLGKNYEITLPVKMVFIGNHHTGKSTLLEYLKTYEIINLSDNESTHIIQIDNYKFGKAGDLPDVITFDFGGQDYYHGIYKVFLSTGAIFILVWDKERNNNRRSEDKSGKNRHTQNFCVNYWLGQKKHFEDNDISKTDIDTLFLVETHIDVKKDMDEEQIPQTCKVTQEFHVSLNKDFYKADNKKRLEYLKAVIESTLRLKQIKVKRPKHYQKLLSDIFEYHKAKNSKNIVKTIEDLKKDYNYSENELKIDLVQFREKGLIFYYPDISKIENKVWLNPTGFAKEVHNILGKELLTEQRGIVTKTTFEESVDNDIIEVLKKQKVIFEHIYAKPPEYIIPGYLPCATDDDSIFAMLRHGLKTTFILKFKYFLPFGFMTSLICHFGNLPEHKKFWRDQIIFTYNSENKVYIGLDFEKLEIMVAISNKYGKNIKDVTRNIFGEIIGLFHGNMEQIKEKVPMDRENVKNLIRENEDRAEKEQIKIVENLFISTDNTHFVKHEDLAKIDKETKIRAFIKENDILTEKSREVSVTPYQPFVNRRLHKMKKVFISYSHDDLKYRKELQKYLINLERTKEIEIWQDGLIDEGEEWDKTIKKSLEEAEIIIMLVSQSFIASSYVHEIEMANAMKRKKSEEVIIFPVLLSNCDWQEWKIFSKEVDEEKLKANEWKIGDFQFFPRDEENARLKPVEKWEFQADVWTELVKKIRKIIKTV